MSRLIQASATGVVRAGPAYVKSFTLTAGVDAAVAALTLDGAEVLRIKAAAAASFTWRSGSPTGAFGNAPNITTLTGTTPLVSIEVD